MSEFTLTIRTNGAAFTVESNDEQGEVSAPHYEVARLLYEVADKVDNDHDDGFIIDINGNSVGTFTFTEDES